MCTEIFELLGQYPGLRHCCCFLPMGVCGGHNTSKRSEALRALPRSLLVDIRGENAIAPAHHDAEKAKPKESRESQKKVLNPKTIRHTGLGTDRLKTDHCETDNRSTK